MKNHIMQNNEDFFNDGITDISEEYVASWLDGNLSTEEYLAFAARLSADTQLSEFLDAYDDVETEFDTMIEEGYELPEELAADFELPRVDPMYFTDTYEFSDMDSDQLEFAVAQVENSESNDDNNPTDRSDLYNEDSEDSSPEEFYF